MNDIWQDRYREVSNSYADVVEELKQLRELICTWNEECECDLGEFCRHCEALSDEAVKYAKESTHD